MTQLQQEISPELSEKLLQTLATRFVKYPERHPGIAWNDIKSILQSNKHKLLSLYNMEITGGEPDVVLLNTSASGRYHFVDCSVQSPDGRRSLCYDQQAREGRKKFPPMGSALELADILGVELLNEEQYRSLQEIGEFDTKTSSWIHTPVEIRNLGGALFCDRRYNQVFTYHNGADSYYAARGFRALLTL